ERLLLVEKSSQDARQFQDHGARSIRADADQRRDGIEGIEKEMRIDLALQRLHTGLQKQLLRLLKLHLDARAGPYLERDGYHHHGTGIDRQREIPAIALQHKHLSRI